MDKIGVGWAFVSDTGKRLVNEMLDANRLSQGSFVRKFEKEFARLHNQKYGIALNSGTSALHVALEAFKEKFARNIDGQHRQAQWGGGYRTRSDVYRFVKCGVARGIEARLCRR